MYDFSLAECVLLFITLIFRIGSSMESSYSVMNSTTMENLNQVKRSNGDCSNNLIRQSSSPAGFLSYMSNENGIFSYFNFFFKIGTQGLFI